MTRSVANSFADALLAVNSMTSPIIALAASTPAAASGHPRLIFLTVAQSPPESHYVCARLSTVAPALTTHSDHSAYKCPTLVSFLCHDFA